MLQFADMGYDLESIEFMNTKYTDINQTNIERVLDMIIYYINQSNKFCSQMSGNTK
jgi:hypothetical protein